MFRLIKYLAEKKGLFTSELFNEYTFDRAFAKDLKRARKKVIVESPFLTERRASRFSPLLKELARRKVDIRINTRHPRYHSKEMNQQAKSAIKILLESNAKVYTYNDLRHRKLAIIDNRILWEGSMNILSHGRSLEIMRRSSSLFLCRQMILYTHIYN